jgi:hypothetical protein
MDRTDNLQDFSVRASEACASISPLAQGAFQFETNTAAAILVSGTIVAVYLTQVLLAKTPEEAWEIVLYRIDNN